MVVRSVFIGIYELLSMKNAFQRVLQAADFRLRTSNLGAHLRVQEVRDGDSRQNADDRDGRSTTQSA